VAVLNCLIFPGDNYKDQHSSRASSIVTSLCISPIAHARQAKSLWHPLPLEAEMLKIHARSPNNINPIGNIFHLVKSQLNTEAVTENISSESYKQFQTRVLQVLRTFPIDIIDKTIDSMGKRINKMILSKTKGY
jgi:hypothetical protein